MDSVDKTKIKINFSENNRHLYHISEKEIRSRKNVNFRKICLQDVLQYIETQDISDEVKNILKQQASKYPHFALEKFMSNFQLMLNSALKKVSQSYAIEPIVEKDTAAPIDLVQHKPNTRYCNRKENNDEVIRPKKIAIDLIENNAHNSVDNVDSVDSTLDLANENGIPSNNTEVDHE